MAGIFDIGFLTRPIRGYAGGDLVINPPTAAEELGISSDLRGIRTFDFDEFLKSIGTSQENVKDANEFIVDHAVGELENQIAQELKSQGYKIDIDWKGIKNLIMGKDAKGNKKSFSLKENRKNAGKLFKNIPPNPAKFLTQAAIKIAIKVGSPATQAIQNYLDRSEETIKNIQKGKEIDEAIAQIDPDLIKNMTGKDLQIYLKDNFDLNVTDRTIYRKIQKNKIPVKPKVDWKIRAKLRGAFSEIGDKDFFETITEEELWAMPQIQKIAKEGFLTPESLTGLRTKMKYPIKRSWVNYFDKFGADHGEVVKYMEENNVRTDDLIQKFPKLQDAVDEGKVKPARITAWRRLNELSFDESKDLKSRQQIKRTKTEKMKRDLHLPSSKDIGNVSPVIKDAIEKEIIRGRAESLHPAMTKHRGNVSGIGDDRITLQNYSTEGHKESTYAVSTDLRNKLQNQFENWIPTVTAKKNKLISQFNNNEIAKKDFLGSLEEINNDLNLAKADMEKLGIMSKLFNPRTRRKEYFGEPYNNTLDLIKDIRNEYNFFSEVGKKYGILGGKEKIPGLKKTEYKDGGLVGINQLTRRLGNF